MQLVESADRDARSGRSGARRPAAAGTRGTRRSAKLSIVTAAAAALLTCSPAAAWAAAGGAAIPAAVLGHWQVPLAATVGLQTASSASNALAVCTKVAAKAGFSSNQTVKTPIGAESRIAVAVAIAMAESSCLPNAVHRDSNGSQDRGLWQINSKAWPKISSTCAFQIQCNADQAYLISNAGTNWKPWATYSNGAWKRYIAAANAAVGSGFSFHLESRGAATCLAASSVSNANGAPVLQASCNAADTTQQWRVVDAPGRPLILQNVQQGSCLDADGMAHGPGNPIFQWICNTTNASEQWWFAGSGALNENGDADAVLHNTEDGTCAAADPATAGVGGRVVQGDCLGGNPYQMWD
ncbi:MAG TPA: RICIN domain-containing protein [Actinocrinis sp.]|nr:RICIN domain-containing protein [Actinocrinis sp.]